eukprot:CAMPEP_0185598542 /NCGR_PEP_ID=MMETSP0434-20130131/82069_1 /TAXON_ID=626734 ORGANISM="Favella taraikaensis, Strain Fe Narragansett Bay" /NCGR_SAMPLE_ID=MMETSP0434 /ASSEMBLY_ACC=CAM_ASM_000379 /LENGTH=71 /DNA_ID=CAMNT_0028227565 /DNA_START=821 /DNA_END=1036 /DNA_ORIENTATION=-
MSCDLNNRRDKSGPNSAIDLKELSAQRTANPKNFSVREFVNESFRSHRGAQSHLKYHPTERALQVNTVMWK